MSYTKTAATVGTHAAAFTLINDGDAFAVAVLMAALEGLIDNEGMLHGALVGTIKVPLTAVLYNADWINGIASGAWWVEQGGLSSNEVFFPVMLPPKLRITGCSMQVDGDLGSAAGGHGALPGTMPRLRLLRVSKTTGGYTEVANAVDGSASVAAYEASHAVTISGLTEDVGDDHYLLAVRGENGANAIANQFAITQLSLTWSIKP